MSIRLAGFNEYLSNWFHGTVVLCSSTLCYNFQCRSEVAICGHRNVYVRPRDTLNTPGSKLTRKGSIGNKHHSGITMTRKWVNLTRNMTQSWVNRTLVKSAESWSNSGSLLTQKWVYDPNGLFSGSVDPGVLRVLYQYARPSAWTQYSQELPAVLWKNYKNQTTGVSLEDPAQIQLKLDWSRVNKVSEHSMNALYSL